MKNIVGIMASILITMVSWKFIPKLDLSQIQYIASTMSTVSGILFGFVMASITILASAKDNKLVQNASKTKYLPELISKLNNMMAFLLFVCLIFLSSLFVRLEDLAYGETKLVSIVIATGVFIFSFSVYNFISVWHEFSKFASHL
jgi:hypothetical protein